MDLSLDTEREVKTDWQVLGEEDEAVIEVGEGEEEAMVVSMGATHTAEEAGGRRHCCCGENVYTIKCRIEEHLHHESQMGSCSHMLSLQASKA